MISNPISLLIYLSVQSRGIENAKICHSVGPEGCIETGWFCPRGQTCKPICGDGLLRGFETCDDGNLNGGDGCDAFCNLEPGWQCDPGTSCVTHCGDGVVGSPMEECDDGNSDDFDGCSSTCKWELGLCKLQAPTLCALATSSGELGVDAFRPRADIPVHRMCARRVCNVQDCCEPIPRSCDGHSLSGGPFHCTDARSWDVRPTERRVCKDELDGDCVLGCGSFKCPSHWHLKDGFDDIACLQSSGCSVNLCCKTSAITCTCREANCCAEVHTPPRVIRGEDGIDVFVDVAGPIAIVQQSGPFPNGTLLWYYFVRGGPMTQVDVKAAFDGKSLYLVGYSITVPSLSRLEGVFQTHHGPAMGEVENLHVWSSTEESPNFYWALHAGNVTTRHQMAYAASENAAKYVVLEVFEAFSVLRGGTSLTRMRLREGAQCCFAEDDKTLAGLPYELHGATFFELPGKHGDHEAGVFTVTTAVDIIVYGLAVYDLRRIRGLQFASGFPKSEGDFMPSGSWQAITKADFFLMPWMLPMGAWRRYLKAGEVLEIQHLSTLYGSIAIQPA